MKKLVIGIIAHVDAGKTTLSEALLYAAGAIDRLGRVDHGDSFLDTDALERKRGITIFSKQAKLELPDTEIMLLDTPGHVDFSAEMERTLGVLDAAILVISGTDGVQGHTETLTGLLHRYEIPTFIFVNKMDLPGADANVILSQLKKRISDNCISFTEKNADFYESIVMCDEGLLERYLAGECIGELQIGDLILRRRLFPVFFGSALKNRGVKELLSDLVQYLPQPKYGSEFGARVYKISRDEKGSRLSFMKITGGSLRVKSLISHSEKSGFQREKVDQIRVYSGSRFQMVDEAEAGSIVTVTGPLHTYAGEGLGVEPEAENPSLVPVFTYRVKFEAPLDAPTVLKALRLLEEEDPSLHVYWQEQVKEIHIQLMGEIQLEILQSIVRERFGMELGFETGNIVYQETIQSTVMGIGHYEPLRHYGEVHLLMEPAPRGSGILISSQCSTDVLEEPYQKQILNSLEQKVHLGVLKGVPVTDIRLTLVAGRAHLKHTEGGDLRQAAWRAVRNGLMKAESVLLEPYYTFRLELPLEFAGRAMTDLRRLSAVVSAPEFLEETAVLTGRGPVATLHEYQKEVLVYTSGKGRFSCEYDRYAPCHNSEEVLAGSVYDPEADLDNTPDSVFCSHGAGFVVPWYETERLAHVRAPGYEFLYHTLTEPQQETAHTGQPAAKKEDDPEELEAIFLRTYGVSKREKYRNSAPPKEINPQKNPVLKEYQLRPGEKPPEELLIVDGYNIIYAWEELRNLVKSNLDAARGRLMDILLNYQGYTKKRMLVVFDAYRVREQSARQYENERMKVVFTSAGETADMYIEKFAHENGSKYRITVATSDGLEQIHVLAQGAVRMSAQDFYEEVRRVECQIREQIEQQ